MAEVEPRRALRVLRDLLTARHVATQYVERGLIQLSEPTVKLLTQQSAKGLDFPVVFVLPAEPNRQVSADDLRTPEAHRTLYVALTRSSEQLTVGARYEIHHPLLDALAPDGYRLEGTRAREFAGTRGMIFPSGG